MALLPEGFALPPPTYLVGLLAAVGAVGWAAARRRPAVTTARVLALAPWMVLGSAVHVLHVLNALPDVVRPLGGTPAVYVAVGVAAAGVWLAADAGLDAAAVPRGLTATGGVVAAGAIAWVGAAGAAEASVSPAIPAAGFVVAVVLTVVVWVGLTRGVPAVEATGPLGAFVVFAHVLDGVSTAVGVDVLGFGERTPLSQVIIEAAVGLPTEPILGTVWLFVVVKIAVASVVVWLFADLMADEPARSRLLLGFVAAVGLGPAVHNLLLFSVAAPV